MEKKKQTKKKKTRYSSFVTLYKEKLRNKQNKNLFTRTKKGELKRFNRGKNAGICLIRITKVRRKRIEKKKEKKKQTNKTFEESNKAFKKYTREKKTIMCRKIMYLAGK